jgi:hypothetical protein
MNIRGTQEQKKAYRTVCYQKEMYVFLYRCVPYKDRFLNDRPGGYTQGIIGKNLTERKKERDISRTKNQADVLPAFSLYT